MSVLPESVQHLLASTDVGDRIRAVNQARTLPLDGAFECLKIAALDRNPRVRYAAVSQIGTVGNYDRVQALEVLRDRLWRDGEPDVQAAASDSLGALQMVEALEDLQHLYHSTTEWIVKFSVVAALGAMGDPRGFELLTMALASENELIKIVAIGAMGELGDTRAIPLLLALVNHSDWQVRHRVAQALKPFQNPETVTALQRLSTDSIVPVCQEAQAILTAWGN